MSFIERALDRFRQEAHVEPAAESARDSEADPAERSKAKPVRVAPEPAVSPIACRADRVVSVDLARLRAAGVLPPEHEERRVAEEYRLIKRPLLRSMTDDQFTGQANLVVLTSAVPEEGKTFTAVNLALSLARERNREVVLIDGDVAKRHISRLLGLDDEEGLLDLGGAEGRDFEHAVFRTDVPNLYVLPAGNLHADATEILRSERIASLLASLASDRRRILLVDAPPLLATSEAGVLTLLAGQILMVVKASETPREEVLRAIETIPEEKPVGLVLNQVLSETERAYGYYYGSYGARDGKARNSPDPARRAAQDGR